MSVTQPHPPTRHPARSATDDGMQARFVSAALACLAVHGHHGTTVRRIAAEAGVAPGLLTHYFTGKDALIAQAYAELADDVLARLGSAVELAGDDAAARLRAFITASFGATDLGPDLLRVWVHFWAMAMTDADVAAAHRDTDATYRTYLTGLLQPFSANHADAADMAIAVAALLDGMWLSWGLDPERFDQKQRVEQALVVVGRIIGQTISTPEPQP
jgi:TetR/AcrR family transcriptional repressor of bet genes